MGHTRHVPPHVLTFAVRGRLNVCPYWGGGKSVALKTKDIRCAEMVLEENKELAISKWNEYFGSSMTEEEEEL